MVSYRKRFLIFLLPILFLTEMVYSQSINRIELDSLLKNGQNFTVLRKLNSLDTLSFKKPDLALFYFYKTKCIEAENKNANAIQSY